MAVRKLPVGIQDFERLIKDGYVYADKTEYIYHLVHEGKPYFLSRPRRFGKSLLLSTLKAYWEGKKELFAGLAIEKLEQENPDAWKPYPVFYFDFNSANYWQHGALEEALHIQLKRWEKKYALNAEQLSLGERFQNLLIAAMEKTGLRCVVLVDEYDKPFLDVMDNPELKEHNKHVFKGFFSTLKSFDAYIRFIFMTGVTELFRLSMSGDLNQLNDISLNKKYACLCGITESEMISCFDQEIEMLAQRRKLSRTDCLNEIKRQYDGYHFSPNSPGVYNPYSLLKCFFSQDFGSYWFETGTPTFLVKKIRDTLFDIRKFTDGTLYASEGMLKGYTGDSSGPVPWLYQTGYLTISDYDVKDRIYTLSFPNEEVKYGFLGSLLSSYVPKATT